MSARFGVSPRPVEEAPFDVPSAGPRGRPGSRDASFRTPPRRGTLRFSGNAAGPLQRAPAST
eukprot:3115876-Lingulodinium_polyedra.AAC.1